MKAPNGPTTAKPRPLEGNPRLKLLLVLFLALNSRGSSQTFTVIHSFTGGAEGGQPEAGLTINSAGDFYGTACSGGNLGYGTVFNLKHSGASWMLTPIYSFNGSTDGICPMGRVAIGPDGHLYGTTSEGPKNSCGGWGCGTVFRLTPPITAVCKTLFCPWNETVILYFRDAVGSAPQGDLVFDQSGNIYGTAGYGGNYCGAIYELIPAVGSWTETVLHLPQNQPDGCGPVGGVVFDTSGNLYGAYYGGGGNNNGAVYQLVPSGPPWTENILYSFDQRGGDGSYPNGGLIVDGSGNLYGTTTIAGINGGGTVFEFTPSGGGWIYKVLFSFTGHVGIGPYDKLVMDSAGNLYGTTYYEGAYGMGSVFKLTPSNGSWSYTSLHDFTGGPDGKYPISNLVLDAQGNLWGTASAGGVGNCPYGGCGVVFEITP